MMYYEVYAVISQKQRDVYIQKQHIEHQQDSASELYCIMWFA